MLRRSITLGLLSSVALFATSTVAYCQTWTPTGRSLVWTDGQEISLRELNCASDQRDGIVIRGRVRLTHPDDDGRDSNFPTIKIECEHVQFEPGAELLTRPNLKMRITTAALGPWQVTSSRGQPGTDGPTNPAIMAIERAPNGKDGPSGADGDRAESHCNFEDGCDDKSAERGDGGTAGGDGEHGRVGSPGEHGRGGRSSSHIDVRAASFAKGATVVLKSIGGPGGGGAKGGRGWEGGNGGAGGRGGDGGRGNELHPGKSGGNGGDGGDGGNGGDGGRGGDGGSGGSGGNLNFYVVAGGSAPEDFDLYLDGGSGGRPGEGGDPGLGGKGGKGGRAGCGGKGGDFLGVSLNADGSCGTDGVPGRDGIDGKQGPPGVWGRDGEKGKFGKSHFGYVKPEDL